jgi:hypothetical protein
LPLTKYKDGRLVVLAQGVLSNRLSLQTRRDGWPVQNVSGTLGHERNEEEKLKRGRLTHRLPS